jgi:hypothetical protein
MRDDPIISGGALKIALALLLVVVLGLGALQLFGDGWDIDLPDLPEIEDSPATNLSDTELSETTIDGAGGGSAQANLDLFTSEGFGSAVAEVREAAGSDAQLTRLFVNDVQTQFVVRRGDGVEAYSVRADTGELTREDASITISGNATIDDFAYPLAAVKPAAIDRMLSAARKESGAGDFRPTTLALERRIPFGSRALEWTINAQGKGRYLLYRAGADGGNVRDESGGGTAIPPAAQEAQKLNDCVSDAAGDTDKILRCLEDF